MHRHHKNVVTAGKALSEASKAMIMIHGRGGSAAGILEIAESLEVADFALLAPQANQHTWYPYSFMAPVANNQPGLDTGLAVIGEILDDILAAGISRENIYLLGFSQGACLTSEFLARNAGHFGGAFIYSGGVIGAEVDRSNYSGDFEGTPILLGCSDVDAHVPLHRVQDTTSIFAEMGAEVTERIYPNGPHTILADEIELTNRILTRSQS
ncbi:alpha/beta hydrolase [Flavilitoribacter nigricans]|uniref:Phospholipase n=1 Tax=Flavilitoribacter nigricans (strain ATCC 23147 / DSM 23189 / NBRC 102662 / NCIMB 1420 / SS-2) TaxID=1122177 RepID=A0A2D0MZE5_FLAN2|nr:dienelactone hydrolase family protein [Flavilitoribacter nigricans]PHN01662.1 phospholipase [Flavilitoribacter nigricans DSM 23189 = NBRC 102662]